MNKIKLSIIIGIVVTIVIVTIAITNLSNKKEKVPIITLSNELSTTLVPSETINSKNTISTTISATPSTPKISKTPVKSIVKKVVTKPVNTPTPIPIIGTPVVSIAPKQLDSTVPVRIVSTESLPVPENRIVVIDPGHGGTEPGAVYTFVEAISNVISLNSYFPATLYLTNETNSNSSTSLSPSISPNITLTTPKSSIINSPSKSATKSTTYKEKDLNLKIALYLKSKLTKAGINVYLTRESDTNIAFNERGPIANTKNAAMLISLHCNANTNLTTSGVETYYYHNYWVGGLKSSEFAQILQSNYVTASGLKSRYVSGENWYSVLVKSKNMISVLIEMGYMSNSSDLANLVNDNFQKNNATEGLANGIIEGLNKMGN